MKSLKYWTPNKFETSNHGWGLHNRKGKPYKTECTNDETLPGYVFNELGFRGDSIYKKGFKIMSIGCSNTEGVGVSYHDTWPYAFSKNILNSVNLNFGMAGRSNDFISRCLLSYYDFIKPDLVLIMYTSPQRREYYTKDCSVAAFMPGAAWGYFGETEDGAHVQKNLIELQNDNEDFINWHKNHLLIKYFLETKKCNWLWNGSFRIPTDYSEFNRFDGDYNVHIDKGTDGLHPGPKHNIKYSIKLFNHINTNFKEYIPKDSLKKYKAKHII